ncbi:MAG: hypothetical protein WAT79_06040 [Saprospiraceae bacterium]
MKIVNILILNLMFLFGQNLQSQCQTWIGLDRQSDAENAHSIYRQALKMKSNDIAFENWEIAYSLAPAADGKRDVHYTDGVEFYKQKWTNSQDPTEKAAFAAKMVQFYREAIECYVSGVIQTKEGTEAAKNLKIGYLYGRLAYDMYYYVNAPYVETIEALDNCIKYSGDHAEYIIMDIYPKIMVYQFNNGYMPKEKVISVYTSLKQIAEYNISNNEKYSEGYQQAQANMNYTLTEIEKDVFDCEYFKDKYIPEFEDNKEDPQVLKYVLFTLKTQGCSENDPDIIPIEEEWKKYAAAENERIQAEFDANNPAAVAKKLHDEGKYGESISKYRQAINEADTDAKKGTYLLAISSIQFRKLNQYSEARKTAYEAAKFRPNWGRPYILIGDMYGKTARSCGDAWNQRLAILAAIDKYSYARSIDGNVSGEAGSRISAYSKSLPDKAEGHMRGVAEGSTETVGCWIGESVRIRFN